MLGIKKRLNLGPLGQRLGLSVLVLVVGIFVSGYVTLQASAVKPQGVYSTNRWSVPKGSGIQNAGFYAAEVSLSVEQYGANANDNYFWGSELNFPVGHYAYIGLQSNSQLTNSSPTKGKVAVFGIGAAKIAATPEFCSIQIHTTCKIPFDWQTGRKYSLIVIKSGDDPQPGGKWSGYIRDTVSGSLTLIGSITTPKYFNNEIWTGLWDKGTLRSEYIGANPANCNSIPYSRATFYYPVRWVNSLTAQPQKTDGGVYYNDHSKGIWDPGGNSYTGEKCTNSSIGRVKGAMTHEVGTSSIDTSKPFVAIASPKSSEVLTSKKFWLNAYANDNVKVVKLEVFVDGKLIKTENRKDTYIEVEVDDKLPSPIHSITVIAYDAAGNKGTYTHQVTYTPKPQQPDTTPPVISMSSPTSGLTITAPSIYWVDLNAVASDEIGVAKVEFKVDDVLVDTDNSYPYGYRWTSISISNGPHTLSATAYDTAGNSKKVTIPVVVNHPDTYTKYPSILLSKPLKTDYVSGDVEMSVMSNTATTKVEFKVDNTIVNTDTTPPYSYRWNSKTVSDLTHSLNVTAYNSSGDKTTVSTKLKVNNSPQKLRIVYAAANFPQGDKTFDAFVPDAINFLLSVDPFTRYRDSISVRSVNLGSVSCPNSYGLVTCNYTEVAQKLAASGVVYDKVVVINYAQNTASNAEQDGNFATSVMSNNVAAHELVHTFGVSDEYITYGKAPLPVSRNQDNCFDPRSSDNVYFKGIQAKDMYPGCVFEGLYKATPMSLMGGSGSTELSTPAFVITENEIRRYLRYEPLVR